MTRLTTLVCAALLLGGCAATAAKQPATPAIDRTDYQYIRYDNIKKIGQQVVAERGLSAGDVVLLVSLPHQGGNHPMHVYDDALISGLVRSGVRVVRLSEKTFYDDGPVRAEGTASAAANLFLDESALVSSLKALRAQGIGKVMSYRWIFSNRPGAGYSDAHFEDTLRYPADRAYVKVVDTANGQVIWASLVTSQTSGAGL